MSFVIYTGVAIFASGLIYGGVLRNIPYQGISARDRYRVEG